MDGAAVDGLADGPGEIVAWLGDADGTALGVAVGEGLAVGLGDGVGVDVAIGSPVTGSTMV